MPGVMLVHVIVFATLLVWAKGDDSCYPCSAGSHSTGECLPSNVTCPAGYCSHEAPQNCSECVPGYCQPNKAQSTCMPCGPGRYNPHLGCATVCPPCLAGSYCPREVNLTPTLCEIGWVCPKPGMVRGYDCSPGYYCDKRGLSKATLCEPGFYCSGGASRVQCKENTYCPAGSAKPNQCFYLFETIDPKTPCSASIGFYIAVSVGGTLLILSLVLGIYFGRKKKSEDEALAKAQEITSLIPKARGPQYRGW